MNEDKFQIIEVRKSQFFLKTSIKNVNDNKVWDLMVVYGAAQKEQKETFLRELAQELNGQKNPLLLGDFNIIRNASEKNKPGGCSRWSFIFNAILEQGNLREIDMGLSSYTWQSCHEDPTFEKLDMVLVTNKLEQMYPHISVQCLEHVYSDHNPLLVDSGENFKSESPFNFETSWFLREDLDSTVSEVWTSYRGGGSSIERWQGKLRAVRKKLKGWNKNWEGRYRREKNENLKTIRELDKKIESVGMTNTDREMRRELEIKLNFTIREERLKWFQGCKDQETIDGDNNTKYYHAKCNGRKRKKQIHKLIQEEGEIKGQ